ncbi:MAG: restriction endonuclease subunit S, partial [Nitrospira sp.]|nr:restriction endonuclease subunit S [Nitrospira sp.]
TLASVRSGAFNPNAIKPISESSNIPEGIAIKNGDLLLTRSNTRELVGDVTIVSRPKPRTIISDLIYKLVPNNDRFYSKFLMYQLLSKCGRIQIEQDARGSSGTMPKIRQHHIRNWRFVKPPMDEQSCISDFIFAKLNDIDKVRKITEQEIALLEEIHIKLISEIVTGKLDVREAVANLPEERESDETEGEFFELVPACGEGED